MRVLGIVVIGLVAASLAPVAAAQQRKFKDEGLQQYLVPEVNQIETKLDKVTFIFNFFDELRRIAPPSKN